MLKFPELANCAVVTKHHILVLCNYILIYLREKGHDICNLNPNSTENFYISVCVYMYIDSQTDGINDKVAKC